MNSAQKIFKPKVVQRLEEVDLIKVEVAKNLFLRVVIDENKEKMIDLRKYYKGFPTKQGLRFSFEVYDLILDSINSLN